MELLMGNPLEQMRARLDLRERQLNAVHDISAALQSQTDVDSLLRQTLEVALQTVDADAGSLLLYNPDKNDWVFEHVIGKTELIGHEIDPEAAENVNGKAATVFRTGQSILTLDTVAEGYNSQFDSETGYVTRSILTVPLKTRGGTPLGVMQALNKRHGSFDEADQELLEIVCSLAATSLANARLAEEAQLAAVARAVGDLGHDIKNALTPIETMVDTTVDAFIAPLYADLDALHDRLAHVDPELRQAIHAATEPLRDWYPEMQTLVSDGCTDIREMVAEIADYIKGTQATYIVENDLELVVQERLRRLRVIARNRRVTIHLDGLRDLHPFPFDRRLVGRALFNLVNNALVAIDEAVKKRTLELRPFNIWVSAEIVEGGTFPDGAYCRIVVRDDGPGVPPRVLRSLFTPQAISTTAGGTGIGTRFVKSVADAHSGSVGVESEPGNGAIFWLKLPLEAREDANPNGGEAV